MDGAWAVFNGATVCSDCFSPTERLTVARRVVSAIEAEVVRAESASEDPSPFEEPLINFAMGLRDALTPPPWLQVC